MGLNAYPRSDFWRVSFAVADDWYRRAAEDPLLAHAHADTGVPFAEPAPQA